VRIVLPKEAPEWPPKDEETEREHPTKSRDGKVSLLQAARMQRVCMILLSGKTVREAAEEMGLNTTTIHTWLRDPTFQSMFRRAGNDIFTTSVRKLQGVADEAVAAMMRAMTCGKPAVELKAAESYFNLMLDDRLGKTERDEAIHFLAVTKRAIERLDDKTKEAFKEALISEQKEGEDVLIVEDDD